MGKSRYDKYAKSKTLKDYGVVSLPTV